jgi:NAD(P)-dependent dehydrogenase (short-subunit alcohol dehydrogenase family)
MRIVIVGASGEIGRAVAAELSPRHEIVAASRNGPARADITDPASMRTLFETVGRVDAIICTAGKVHFAPLSRMTTEHLRIGLDDKLMGQVGLAMIGESHLADHGSITLTGGVLSERPILGGASGSMINAALEGFVRAAAVEWPRIRINLVSPTVLVESLPAYGAAFRGFEAAPAARVALAYSRSVEGPETGQVYRVH